MNRAKLPKAPQGVKISPSTIRCLAHYAKSFASNKHAALPCVALNVDGYWSSPITIYCHNWRRFDGECGNKQGIRIGYSSGGSVESDNYDYLRNFSAALLYAIELVDWLDAYFALIEKK